MYPQPPKYARQFLRWFCREDYLEEIEGDLIEIFDQQAGQYARKARWKFRWQVLRHLRPDFIKTFENPHIIHTAMLKHNLLITYRSFLRNKRSFLINLVGLSTGLACALLIYLWVQDERKMDGFHENDKQLYQVRTNFRLRNGNFTTGEVTPALLGNTLLELPEVASVALMSSEEEHPRGIFEFEDEKVAVKGIYASNNFFDLFSYVLLAGDTEQVLSEKSHIVISEGMAYRLFGSVDKATGKLLRWQTPFRGQPEVYIVAGVFENLPSHSTESFDFVLHLDVFLDANEWAKEWNGSSVETFALLNKGADISKLNDQFAAFLPTKSQDPSLAKTTLFFQQYSQKYLYNRFENGVQAGGRITYVKLFSLIGLFILLIACINFMNLSTAKASTKMKQIGVKKTIGASRKALMMQFLSESLLISSISGFLALAMVGLILPEFNQVTGKQLSFPQESSFMGVFAIIVLATGLVAGSYPALYLSGLKPLSVLKGKLQDGLGELWIRRGLVVGQFVLSVIFIVGVLVVNRQMAYIQNKNLGYDRDHVLYFQRAPQSYDLQVFMSQLKGISGVVNATAIHGGSIVENRNQGSGFMWSGDPAEMDMRFMRPQVGLDFFETLDIQLVEGRTFSQDFGNDSMKLVVNEAAAEIMGRENIVGRKIMDGDFEKEIVGVVQNFHIKSLHEPMQPCVARFIPGGRNVMVKIQASREQETLESVQQLYEEFHPAYDFQFSFLDDDYQQLYESEMRVASLSKYFSVLAILISCLGLLGLASFTAERRQKELGIRKVLGASAFQLVQLLSTDFTKMVGLAIVIAVPISYFLARNWLADFAYRIDLHLGFFLLAAGATLMITWLTVGAQTYRVASLNPVESLRDE